MFCFLTLSSLSAMDWNSYNNSVNPNLARPPFSPPARFPGHHHDSASLSFFYNYSNHYDPYQVMEMKHDVSMMGGGYDQSQEKKKRLTTEQLELLENSFQEEIKLDPDRKTKLAKDLGLQPRQIAVWFQNRRARWKAKQLERLYDSVKQELDVVSRENQKLQEEVLALRAIVKEQGGYRKPGSTGYTEVSGTEETVESSSNRIAGGAIGGVAAATAGECSYVFNVNDYDPAATMATYWAGHLPSYP